MRSRTVLFSAVAVWLFVAAVPIASADIIQDLTVDISSCNSCSSTFFPGYPQDPPYYYIAPGHGSAYFSPLGLPWAFSFTTALPTSWSVAGYLYGLTFGQGGVFNMTGPYGLTFAGMVDYGASYHALGQATISVNFSGYWSNGLSAEGSIFQTYTAGNPAVYTASLNTSPTSSAVPEPGSLLLLTSSVLIFWKFRR